MSIYKSSIKYFHNEKIITYRNDADYFQLRKSTTSTR